MVIYHQLLHQQFLPPVANQYSGQKSCVARSKKPLVIAMSAYHQNNTAEEVDNELIIPYNTLVLGTKPV